MKTLLFLAFFYSFSCLAGPTVVGNGDDGSDLENFKEIKSGKIKAARDEAIKVLNRLHTAGIPHLGNLLPELENSKLYMVDRNISPDRMQELGAFHSGSQKLVYARTIPRPYAVTRFFAVANELDLNQLIALHIHEALHRSLPERFREDEKIVSDITLAIVTPLATHDQVASITKKNIDNFTGKIKSHFLQHNSNINIVIKNTTDSSASGQFEPIKQSYSLINRIYPFDNKWSLLGLGVDLNYISNRQHSLLTTLGFYASIDLFTLRGFDISFYSLWSRDLGNATSISDYAMARDSLKNGLVFKKRSGPLEITNKIEYQWQRDDKRSFNGTDYQFSLGSVTKIDTEFLYQQKTLSFGPFAKLYLIGSSRQNQQPESGRSSVFALGPKLIHKLGDFKYELNYHHVLDSGKDNNFLSFNDQMIGADGFNHLELKITYDFK